MTNFEILLNNDYICLFIRKILLFQQKIILSTKILHFFLHNLNFALKRAQVSWRRLWRHVYVNFVLCTLKFQWFPDFVPLKMNFKVYEWCAVPHCINTSLKTPNKLFVYVPHKKMYEFTDLLSLYIPFNHIVLWLNNSFRELGDDFAIDPTYASKIFAKNIPNTNSVLRHCIVKLDHKMNKIRFRKIVIDVGVHLGGYIRNLTLILVNYYIISKITKRILFK